MTELTNSGHEPIILDAGDAFFAKGRPEGVDLETSILRARTLVDGYNIIGCDALNVGTKDFGAGMDFLMDLKKSARFPLVSANIFARDTGELLFDPYVIVEKGDFSFAVIGVTTKLPGHVKNLGLRDPVKEAKRLLEELTNKVDYRVILFNGTWDEVSDAKGTLADADFIFLSGDVRTPNRRRSQPAVGSKLYRLGKQGQSLAVIRMGVGDMEAPLTDITSLKQRYSFIGLRLERLRNRNPSVKLEESYKGNPRALETIRQMKDEYQRIEGELAQFENTVEFDFVPMGKTIKDDPTLLSMVSTTLSACSKLEGEGTDQGSVSSSGLPFPGQEARTGSLP